MATRSLGTLTIDLVAKSSAFEQGMDRAARAADKRLSDIERRANQVGFAIGAAIASAGTALAYMVKQSINNMDSLTKLAQSVGSTTQELSALTYAADLSGVSQESLGTALVRLSKNASDAAQGVGEARKGFDALGISVKNADGTLKSSGDLLIEVAGKFAQYKDGAEKTALAVALFGRAGAQLIPLLNSGADGLRELTDEAEELGLTFDQRAGKAAEQFNDNLTRLNAVKNGLANRITQELLPSLVNLTDRLVGSAKSAERLDEVARAAATGVKLLGSVAAIVAGIFRTVGEAIGGVAAGVVALVQGEFAQAWSIAKDVSADVVGNIKQTVGDISAIWDDTASEVAAGADANAEKIAAPAIKAERKVKSAGKKIRDEAQRIWENIERQISGISRSILTFGLSEEQKILIELELDGADEEQLARARKLLSILAGLREEEERRQKLKEQNERATQVLDDLNLELEALGKSAEWVAKRNALLNAGVTAESEMGKKIIETVEALYKQGKAIGDQIRLMDDMRGEFANFFEDIISGTESVSDAFKNLL
ncbi:MAG TPA: phage tail tape measure protein, partial [Methylophilaceae bacterium]